MPSEARQKETGKNYIGLKMLNFGASKPGVGGGPSPDLRLDSPWRLNIFKLETPLTESIKCHNFHGDQCPDFSLFERLHLQRNFKTKNYTQNL